MLMFVNDAAFSDLKMPLVSSTESHRFVLSLFTLFIVSLSLFQYVGDELGFRLNVMTMIMK